MIAFQIKKLFAVINMLVIALCFYAYFINPESVTGDHLFGFVFWLVASIATYKILCAVTDMCASIFTAYKGVDK